MAAFCIILLIVFSLLNDGGQSATWSASSLQDGQQLYACVGDNVTLTWKYTMNTGEDLVDVQWLYTGHSQELVAIFTRGIFLPTPTFSQRVTWENNTGLTISKVLFTDSGNYSMEVNIYPQAGAHHLLLRRTATVHVSGQMLTTDGALHVFQDPDPVYNSATGKWVIQLQCGHFIFQENPPLYVEWTTPSGRVYNSTGFSRGNFYFHIPMPVETGNYVCSIPAHLAARACLHGNVSQSHVAVRVESVEARLLLLEKENSDLKLKLAHANDELSATRTDLASRLTSQNQDVQRQLANTNSITTNLETRVRKLEADIASHNSGMVYPSKREVQARHTPDTHRLMDFKEAPTTGHEEQLFF